MADPIIDPATGLPKVEAKVVETPPVDLTKAIEGLLAKHVDSNGALRVLLTENHAYRDQLRDVKAKLPAEGSLTLTAEDAKAWGSYRELGIPKDLKTRLAEGDTFKAEATGFKAEKHLAKVAGLHEFNATVLTTLAKGLDIEIGVNKAKDGKESPAAFVVTKGEKEGDAPTKTLLSAYADAHWKEFAGSLSSKPARATIGTPTVATVGNTARPRVETTTVKTRPRTL